MAISFIYFIQHPETGLIKIGRSARPESRLEELSRVMDCRLRILATIEETEEMRESTLHLRFGAFQNNGEWFFPHPEILSFIEAHRGRPDLVIGFGYRRHIGEVLAALRGLTGLTQAELGERCGLLQASVSRYELGLQTPRPNTISRILSVFQSMGYDITPSDLSLALRLPSPSIAPEDNTPHWASAAPATPETRWIRLGRRASTFGYDFEEQFYQGCSMWLNVMIAAVTSSATNDAIESAAD